MKTAFKITLGYTLAVCVSTLLFVIGFYLLAVISMVLGLWIINENN